jgi:7-cyano-7-deazaguanine synthase
MDSAVSLACARRNGFACVGISFDYGQRHVVELEAAARVARAGGAMEHRVVRVDLSGFGGSALTDAQIDVPKDRDERAMGADVPVTYVPARNLVFLSLATALAETRGSSDLYTGVNAVDYSGYPDCRAEFVGAFEKAATLGTRQGTQGGRQLRVHAPLVNLSKVEIVKLGVELGVDFSLTHTCYDPDAHGLACGHCDACIIRARAFVDAGVADPTRYQSRGAMRKSVR